jgi:hypothetical protein
MMPVEDLPDPVAPDVDCAGDRALIPCRASITTSWASSSRLRVTRHPCVRCADVGQRPAQRRDDRVELSELPDHHPLDLGPQARKRALEQPGLEARRPKRHRRGVREKASPGRRRHTPSHWSTSRVACRMVKPRRAIT